MRALLLSALLVSKVYSQGCSNTCPPINFGTPVPSLCEGDLATESTANVEKQYSVCHPQPSTFKFTDFLGVGRVTVLSNFYIGCNAGRRESGVFAHTAQKYFNRYGNRTTFITSLKGGTTCEQWAGLYQEDALDLFPDSTVTPKEMPLTVLDENYEIRDDWFTTPFGHPSYVVLDGDLRVRHKIIGPCCGYEGYFDCTADIAVALDETLSQYIDDILMESGELTTNEQQSTSEPITSDAQPETAAPQPTCVAGEFSQWSPCSVTCGAGVQFRWRTVTPNGASLDSCPVPVETTACVGEEMTCPVVGCLEEFGETWEVATVATGFDGPRDVAFHPTPGLHLRDYSEGRTFHPEQGEEAWVVNAFNHSVSIVAALGSRHQTTISRRDRGYYHYMINATALAFNTVANSNRAPDRDSFNYFAVCNANSNTYLGAKEPNYFMGPTLYNTDPENFNTVSRRGEQCEREEQCFFLHADMLHEAPDCVGMAHDPETTTAFGNVYWAFARTGNNVAAQIVRFDFQQPHGPGSMDHSVAAIRRFPELEFARGPPGIHAGMVVHPTRRELYVSVPGENRVVIINADSGSYARTAREEYPIFSNRLPSFEYNIHECVEHRELASNIRTPTGLALSPDGETLFVAERDTGKILALEVQTGAQLGEITTEFRTIGGLAFSPQSKILHFVDEATNTLNAIKPMSVCANPAPSRVADPFASEIARAKSAVDTAAGREGVFSIHRDFACAVNPTIPDAVYFDQVHDTGYASDDPDVQAMAGMDETAALLANRTDCGATSELNFDALLLGGYYCHQCLPVNNGAMCDSGGACTNIQWLGYYCDNEFFLTYDEQSNEVLVTTGNGTRIERDVLELRGGVTYRFTVKLGDKSVCLYDQPDGSSSPLSLLGNSGGCATRGPLMLEAGNSLPQNLYLATADGPVVALVVSGSAAATATGGDFVPGTTIFTTAPADPMAHTNGSEGPNTGLIVGISLGCVALLLLVGVGAYFAVLKGGKGGSDVKQAPTMMSDQ